MGILDNQKGKSQDCDLQKGTLNCRNVHYVVFLLCTESWGFILMSSGRVVGMEFQIPKRISSYFKSESALSASFFVQPVLGASGDGDITSSLQETLLVIKLSFSFKIELLFTLYTLITAYLEEEVRTVKFSFYLLSPSHWLAL